MIPSHKHSLGDRNAEPPPPALSDAIQASMNEAHENLMTAALLSRSLSANFNREEYAEFEQVYQRYEDFCEVRARDQKTLMELSSKYRREMTELNTRCGYSQSWNDIPSK